MFLTRDEKEGRKRQAWSNKQLGKATQHTQGSHFFLRACNDMGIQAEKLKVTINSSTVTHTYIHVVNHYKKMKKREMNQETKATLKIKKGTNCENKSRTCYVCGLPGFANIHFASLQAFRPRVLGLTSPRFHHQKHSNFQPQSIGENTII